MYYSSRRRRNGRRIVLAAGVLSVLLISAGWWIFRGRFSNSATPPPIVATERTEARPRPGAGTEPSLRLDRESRPELDRLTAAPPTGPSTERAAAPEMTVRLPAELASDDQPLVPRGATGAPRSKPDPGGASGPAPTNSAEKPALDVTPSAREPQTASALKGSAEAALRKYQTGDKIAARHELNALLAGSSSEAERRQIRDNLARIADEMIFSQQRFPGDPLIEEYTVQPGDVLVNIAKKFNVPHGVIMKVNEVTDRIRASQKLKIPRGPFNVRIQKSDFRMDLYLQDLYVRSYRVGLGTAGGTPTGAWKVKNKLENPTFYPPASYSDKRIIAPGDPKNPLGKHWIGLEGIDGEAKGHEGFGIHGTIDPDSIGREASLGCIRMHNEEVAIVYGMLQSGQSTVTVLP